MLNRKRVWAGLATFVAVGAASLSAIVPAGAAISQGPFIDIGCSRAFNVLVYTVVNQNNQPTGGVAALPWACGSSPDLQNYVRVSQDQAFGNIMVRVYPNRTVRGVPLGLAVVDGGHHN